MAGTPVHRPGRAQVPIESVQLGERVTTFQSGEDGIAYTWDLDDTHSREGLRHIKLELPGVQIELLRSLDWIEDYGAHVGGSVFLDMPEMGVEGQAEVLAIEPCPPLEEGEGRLVTGTFKHTSGEVYDLKLESESKPIGVTATHPFWSVDREAWVSAIDLEMGETLKTLAGTTVVQSRSKREEPETVYNIEVEGDHCYRVGESGVLVHNASNPCDSMAAGFSNRQVVARNTVSVNVPAATPPAGHAGPFIPAPAASYTLTIPNTVTVKLETPMSDGSAPDREIKWALTNPNNPNRIGHIVGTETRSDSVGHIVDRKFGGETQR